MKKVTAIRLLGALAVLGSSASMAATVNVVPSVSSPIPFPPSSNFSVTLQVVGMPGDGTTTGSTGSTLTWYFNPAVVSATGAALSGGSPLDFITAPTSCGSGCIIISALRNAAGYAVGNFNAYQVNFTTVAAGDAQINVFDDGVDNSWTDQDANPIPMSYNQATVTVGSAVPVPAAVWMLVSALGSLAGIKRLRRA